MECNKDEALRAKQIAENKMQSGDFVGALKFATKAKRLFPEVQNIAQILTVCEVHCAAQNKLSGSDMDWYGILQTDQSADEATIKKQYRKLALLLHPDKNKSAGAEAAFKLLGEANRFLSDQTKRSAYDSRIRGLVGTTVPKVPSYHPNRNSSGVKIDGNVSSGQNASHSHSHAQNHLQRDANSFWTSCPNCNFRYQCKKTVLNGTMLCQTCKQSFPAHDMGDLSPPWPSSTNHKEPPKHVPPKEASKNNGGKPSVRGPMDKFVRPSPVPMSKCTAGVGVSHKVETSHVTAGLTKASFGASKPGTSKAKESQTRKNVGSKRARQSASDSRDNRKAENVNDMKDTNVRENGADPSGLDAGVHRRKSSRKKQRVSYTAEGGDSQSSPKRSRQHESFNIAEVGRKEVGANGGLFGNSSPAGFTAGVAGQNGEMRNEVSAPPEESVLKNKRKIEQSNLQRKEGSKSDVEDRKPKADRCSPLNSNSPPNAEISWPDPDFSDFEKDRAEDCFAANQFWAVFDDIDSMPRFYALIRKVYSPFKLQYTWLEADSDDQGEIDWHDAGLPVACGKYKLGKTQRTTDRNMFSHQIHCIKRSDIGSYLVYPEKGETWAIFSDWDIGWSSSPENHSEYQFEYVEVVSDFDENIGIRVSYLGKVKGFVSLFQESVQNGFRLFCIPPNNLYRFSHRIPSYKMAGNEREGVPRGSFELDPAGLPLSLFGAGDSGDVKMEAGVLNNGVNASSHKSSMSEAEQAMSNEGTHKVKLQESNAAGGVSQILRKSPRSNAKSMNNGQASTSQNMVRENDKDIGHRDYSQPEGLQTHDKFKTPLKHDKNNYGSETLKVRRSPRDLSKKNHLGDAGDCSDADKSMNDSIFSELVGTDRAFSRKDCSVGASCYDLRKEKSREMFQCDQIWAIYGKRDNMPHYYAQIKKIESTPLFRLHVSELEPCLPSEELKGTISCGTFKVKKDKSQVLYVSAFSHQLEVEPMSDNRYDIYPRKGQIWALYKDQNYEVASSGQGRGECHIVEVLADSDRSIQVVILKPHNSSQSQPIFKAPRIQRSKTGIDEISREKVGRFSHQIPAFQHNGEGDLHLRGCWVPDPSSVPGFLIQID